MTYLPITNPSEATGNNPKSANSSREIHNRGVEGEASRISTRWWNDFQKLWPGLSGREERVRVKTGYVSRNKHSPRACLPHQEGEGEALNAARNFLPPFLLLSIPLLFLPLPSPFSLFSNFCATRVESLASKPLAYSLACALEFQRGYLQRSRCTTQSCS